MCKVQFFVCLFVLATVARADKDAFDYGQGFQILGKIVRQFLNSQPEDLKIGEGVHLVTTQSANEITGRAMEDGGSVLSAMENYLKSHEIRIKLPELLPKEDLGRSLKAIIEDTKEDAVTGRGKKGGGYGGVVLLGMMFGKMMAALGLGGVGLLAMKALMVSAMALMLSMIIGIKKLASHGGDEGGYHVIHATAHGGHDRKKREAADIAYNYWQNLYGNKSN